MRNELWRSVISKLRDHFVENIALTGSSAQAKHPPRNLLGEHKFLSKGLDSGLMTHLSGNRRQSLNSAVFVEFGGTRVGYLTAEHV